MTPSGRLIRLAASDADKLGRDRLVAWIRRGGPGRRDRSHRQHLRHLASAGQCRTGTGLIGSHIDTVIDAGIYDGCYGVLAGLEVIETLKAAGFAPARPIAVAAFTNEEGVRYAPDMLGSLVTRAGSRSRRRWRRSAPTAVARRGAGTHRLRRRGAARLPRSRTPMSSCTSSRGRCSSAKALPIGAVENLQGISWQRVTIDGVANHAGTTPMSLRRDAGHAAAASSRSCTIGRTTSNSPTRRDRRHASRFEPNAINVIPSRATFTVDLRDPDEQRLQAAGGRACRASRRARAAEGVTIAAERLARFEPVTFDASIVALVEARRAAARLGVRRMTSGAGHDAQMIARIAPAAMIFVPSVGGISHSPREHTRAARSGRRRERPARCGRAARSAG